MVRVTDSGRPTKSAEVDVRISISRFTAPVFNSLNNVIVKVEDSRPIGDFVFNASTGTTQSLVQLCL